MSDEKPQSMVLYGAYEPPLKGGEYEVRVVRNVIYTDPRDTNEKHPDSLAFTEKVDQNLKFRVATAQYSLPPDDIFERYPADGAKGVFKGSLPHIVLSRRTLPWERAPKERGPASSLARPWLALLLLSKDELGTETQGKYVPLYDVKTVPVPDPATKNESYQLLELPCKLLKDYAPSWESLPYTAHVREVGNTANMDKSGIEDNGWFSVIICSRLVRPGVENHVFLISLEDLPDYPANDNDRVSVVLLARWRFVDCSNEPEGKTFGELLKGLNCAPLRHSTYYAMSDKDSYVRSILRLGYVPLVQHTAEGQSTVSWYRGPLTPHFIPTPPENMSYPSADAALRYDNEKGLLDVSYAAAWQLGRLLGLQDQPFARALNQIKTGVARKAAEKVVEETLIRRFGKSLEQWQKLVENIFHDDSADSPSARNQGTEAPDYYEVMQSKIAGGTEIPPDIRRWLGRLFRLHGVPFHYLVPDPGLLPPESLRFFYLDSGWIAALMDGALSIGWTPQSQLYIDKAMAGNFLAETAQNELGVSTIDASRADAVKVIGHITGFMLRSRLVAAWRGIEITAKDKHGPLGPDRILRIQRVTDDTLLVIYNAQIQSIVITQPPQGMHFGPPSWEESQLPTSGMLALHEMAAKANMQNQPAKFAGKKLLKERQQRTIGLNVVAKQS